MMDGRGRVPSAPMPMQFLFNPSISLEVTNRFDKSHDIPCEPSNDRSVSTSVLACNPTTTGRSMLAPRAAAVSSRDVINSPISSLDGQQVEFLLRRCSQEDCDERLETQLSQLRTALVEILQLHSHEREKVCIFFGFLSFIHDFIVFLYGYPCKALKHPECVEVCASLPAERN